MVDPIQHRSSPLPTDNDPSAPALPPPLQQAPNLDAALTTVLANTPGTTADVILAMTGQTPTPLQRVATTGAGHGVSAMQAKLDAFFQSAAGPYRVDGQVAWAPSQFRMNGGYNQTAILKDGADADPHKDLVALAASAHLSSDLRLVQVGRGTPEQVVRVTQMLIDAGRLPAGPEPVGDRIRKMQWSYAVGLDCAGYVQTAFLTSRGATRSDYGLRTPDNENLLGLAQNAAFKKIDPTGVKTGDVCAMSPVNGFGHTAIVYAHTIATQADVAELTAKYGDSVRPMVNGGNVHILEVDSSWGAGEQGAPGGGGHRQTWRYNDASHNWAQLNPNSGSLQLTDKGPYNHPLLGFFRPRRES
jgi:hypothetical protein